MLGGGTILHTELREPQAALLQQEGKEALDHPTNWLRSGWENKTEASKIQSNSEIHHRRGCLYDCMNFILNPTCNV